MCHVYFHLIIFEYIFFYFPEIGKVRQTLLMRLEVVIFSPSQEHYTQQAECCERFSSTGLKA